MTLAAYTNSLSAPFIFDDSGAIVRNPTIRHLWPIWPVLFAPTFASVAGRPILNLSLAINFALGGLDVWGYHVANLIFHALAALALFGVVRRTLLLPTLVKRFGEVATQLAMVITLLWAIHPLQTESVTYIVQRGEAMIGALYLLAIYCFIRSIESPRPVRWQAAAVISCILGTATKEVIATAPLVIFLFDWAFVSGSLRQALRSHWRFFAALASTWIILAVLMSTSGKREGTAGYGLGMGVWEYARLQFGFILHYLRLCFWPWPLVLDYGMNTTRSSGRVISSMIVVAALLLLSLWAFFTRFPKLGFLGLCFFLILAPTSSIVPLPGQVAAEHRMYLPLISVIALVVLLGHRLLWDNRSLPQRLRTVGTFVLLGIATVGLMLRTIQRNNEYRQPVRVWQEVVRAVPDNARGYTALGGSLFEAGRYAESVEVSSRAIELEPRDPTSFYNRGTAEQQLGQFDQAIADFTKTIELMPKNVPAYINRGSAYEHSGRNDLALADFQKAIELQPDSAQAYYNIGALHQLARELDTALLNYSRAIELRPDYVDAYNNRGLIYQLMRAFDLAAKDFDRAIELNPRYASAYANRGAVRLMTGQFQPAIDDLTRSIDLNPGGAGSYANRAIAYYYLKNYPQAWADVDKAKSLGAPIDPKFLQNLSTDSGRTQ